MSGREQYSQEEYRMYWNTLKTANPNLSKNTKEGIENKLFSIKQLRKYLENKEVNDGNRRDIIARFYALGTLEKNFDQTRSKVFKGNDEEKKKLIMDSKITRSRFWGGGEGQFSSKIMSKSNEELTLMMKDTDKWDGFWTNNPEGAPESTMGTTTPRTIETGLTPREGEESDFPTSGEDEPLDVFDDLDPTPEQQLIFAKVVSDLTPDNTNKVLEKQDEIFNKIYGVNDEESIEALIEEQVKEITGENFVEDDSGGVAEPRIPTTPVLTSPVVEEEEKEEVLMPDPTTEQEPVGINPQSVAQEAVDMPLETPREVEDADIDTPGFPIPEVEGAEVIPPEEVREMMRRTRGERRRLAEEAERQSTPPQQQTQTETSNGDGNENVYTSVEQQVGTRTQPSQIQNVLSNLDSGVLTEVANRRRQGLSINKLKEDIKNFHNIYDNVIPIFKNKDHIQRKNRALKSNDKRVVLEHYEEMENAIANYYKNDSGFKLGVIISAESLFSGSIFGQNSKDLQASGMLNAMGETPVDKSSFERGGIKAFNKTKIVEPTYTRGGIDHALQKPVVGKMPKFKKKITKTDKNVRTIPTAVHRPYNHILNRPLRPTNDIVIKGRKK